MNERRKFNLTEKQRNVLDFIEWHYAEHGVMPTQNEMAIQLGLAQATVAKHLAAIERRGWIQRANGYKNGLMIL